MLLLLLHFCSQTLSTYLDVRLLQDTNRHDEISDNRRDCLEQCDTEEARCTDDCQKWKAHMQEKSGFTVRGRRIIPLHRNDPTSIKDLNLAARIITKFDNFCRDKCSYTAESCSASCDKDALRSLQNSRSLEYPSLRSFTLNSSTPPKVADYLVHCRENCRSLKQRCVSRLLHEDMDVVQAYFLCKSVQEECDDICESSAAELLSGSLELDTDSISTVIDLSLLRPSIPQQLYGPKKTPARKMKRADSQRAATLESGLIRPQMRKEKENVLRGWQLSDEVTRGRGRTGRYVAGVRERESRQPGRGGYSRYPLSDGMAYSLDRVDESVEINRPVVMPNPQPCIHTYPQEFPPDRNPSYNDKQYLTKKELIILAYMPYSTDYYRHY